MITEQKGKGGNSDERIFQIRSRPGDNRCIDLNRHYHLSNTAVVPHGIPSFIVIIKNFT
jgi:hypothetical protein